MRADREEALSLLRRFRDDRTNLQFRLYLQSGDAVLFGRISTVSDKAIKFDCNGAGGAFTVALDRERKLTFSFDEQPRGALRDKGLGETVWLMFGSDPIEDCENYVFSEVKG